VAQTQERFARDTFHKSRLLAEKILHGVDRLGLGGVLANRNPGLWLAARIALPRCSSAEMNRARNDPGFENLLIDPQVAPQIARKTRKRKNRPWILTDAIRWGFHPVRILTVDQLRTS